VDRQRYTAMPDQNRLSLILLTSRLLLQDGNTLPGRIYVADAETGDLLGVEGEIY